MSVPRTVAIIGKGRLGSVVLSTLAEAGFKTTVISRSPQNDEALPPNTDFKVVDYNSLDSLVAALSGQDVVVSTVNLLAVPQQKLIIDAAIKAGVERFIPSDFGSISTDLSAAHLLHNIQLVEIQNNLKSNEDLIEWTVFSIGAFTEFLVNFDIAFDWQNKSAEIWGDGGHRISTTSLLGTAKAIAAALKDPSVSKNRVLHVHELAVTQSQLLTLAQKFSPGTTWKIKTIDNPLEEMERLGKVAQQNPEPGNIYKFVRATLLSGRFQAFYEQVDNELLGLGLLTEDDLEAKFAAAFG
ncbi:unnamed protein product [Clonostachys rosea]|uniref:NmrA-like domain-containing protein n=1 Tax=Bionectria ochroleuca TaxID=29856 RepID=A0ABY6U987_BIOOC|nr:unnamed protein product [Clonostachys rosea]